LLERWWSMKRSYSFTRDSKATPTLCPSWWELWGLFQPSCTQRIYSTRKIDTRWQSNLLLKCPHLQRTHTERLWAFQSYTRRRISDTWKISCIWCSPIPWTTNSKSSKTLWELLRLSGSAMLSTSKMPQHQQLELQEALMPIPMLV